MRDLRNLNLDCDSADTSQKYAELRRVGVAKVLPTLSAYFSSPLAFLEVILNNSKFPQMLPTTTNSSPSITILQQWICITFISLFSPSTCRFIYLIDGPLLTMVTPIVLHTVQAPYFRLW